MNTPSAAYTKPLPRMEPLTAPFWQHAKAHRLAVQHCPHCGDIRFPPTQVCPNCLGEDQDWKIVSGGGKVLYWVFVHRAYWPGFEKDLPYNVCAIELDEGPVLLSNLVGVPREKMQSGMKVRAIFEDVTPDVTLPKFAPA